ncbi:hypothetical protein ACFSTD_19340 [Novosphingobium colocasiae]
MPEISEIAVPEYDLDIVGPDAVRDPAGYFGALRDARSGGMGPPLAIVDRDRLSADRPCPAR